MKSGQDEFVQQEGSHVRIKVIVGLCISAATCVIHAQDTFDLDDDGIAYVKEATWDEAIKIYEAAKSCPTRAIILEDLEGNVLWPK